MSRLLQARVRGTRVLFPATGPRRERALKIPTRVWLRYPDRELVLLATEGEELFELVWGGTEEYSVPAAKFGLGSSGGVASSPGLVSVVRRVTQMREYWVEFWLLEKKLRLAGKDCLVERFLDAKLFLEYGEATGLGDHPDVREVVDVDVDVGAAVSDTFERRLKADVQTFRVWGKAQKIIGEFSTWNHGKTSFKEVVSKGSAKALSITVFRQLGNLVERRYPGEFGTGAKPIQRWLGEGDLMVYGGCARVRFRGIPGSRLHGFPESLINAVSRWADEARNAFDELGKVGGLSALPKLSERSRTRLLALGVRTDRGVRRKDGWEDAEVRRISRSSGIEVGGFYRRLEAMVKDYVEDLEVVAGVRGRFGLAAVEDPLTGSRPGLSADASDVWGEVERVARFYLMQQRVTTTMGGEVKEDPRFTRVDWCELRDRRLFVERWYSKELEEGFHSWEEQFGKHYAGKFVAPSWVLGLGEIWARAVVCLEGAMQAYLRAAGFGIMGGIWSEGRGEFWGEMGMDADGSFNVDLKSVPAWRWQLLREAYLAAWVWAWGQVLYGQWTPFDEGTTRRWRQALPEISALWGWWMRGSRGPSWEGMEVKELPGVEAVDRVVVPYCGSDYLANVLQDESGDPKDDRWGLKYRGREFVFLTKGKDRSSGQEKMVRKRWPVVGAPLVRSMASGGPFVRSQEGELGVGPRGPGARFLGAPEGNGFKGYARAFQVLANLFLAPHSRYSSLMVAADFGKWVEKEKLSRDGLKIFGQFGCLGSEEWLAAGPAGAGEKGTLFHLFAGLVWKGEGVKFGQGDFGVGKLDVTSFWDWVRLGSQGAADTWRRVERSPLAYPMIPVARAYSGPQSAQWVFPWFDRVLRAVVRGRCPFSLLPLNDLPVSEKDASSKDYPESARCDFLRWRGRIWEGVLGRSELGRYVEDWAAPDNPEWGRRVSAEVGRLYAQWVRPLTGGKSKSRETP